MMECLGDGLLSEALPRDNAGAEFGPGRLSESDEGLTDGASGGRNGEQGYGSRLFASHRVTHYPLPGW